MEKTQPSGLRLNSLAALPDTARLWFYTSDREFSKDEADQLQADLQQFVQQWNAHGQKLVAASEIFYHRVIVLAVDESAAMASGCSIDDSTRFIKQCEQKYHVELFNRMLVCYINDESRNAIDVISMSDFWAKRKAGILNDHTVILDMTIGQLGELKNNWQKPLAKSWIFEMWK